jgi:hypothetical protein
MARGRRIKGARDVGVRAGAFRTPPLGGISRPCPVAASALFSTHDVEQASAPNGRATRKATCQSTTDDCEHMRGVQRHIPPRVPVFVISASRTKAVRTVTTQA